jgi:hypothetical protein
MKNYLKYPEGVAIFSEAVEHNNWLIVPYRVDQAIGLWFLSEEFEKVPFCIVERDRPDEWTDFPTAIASGKEALDRYLAEIAIYVAFSDSD